MGNEFLLDEFQRIEKGAHRRLAVTPSSLMLPFIVVLAGATVSAVARRHGVNPNQVFALRKQYEEGSLAAVKAGEAVVPASQLAAAMKEIRELQCLLGKKRRRRKS